MEHPSLAYLPVDRVYTLAHNQELPSTFSGSLLSLDISGFTRLTEQLTATLGTRLGANALAEVLNQVYNTLIEHLESWGGSVISFSGDGLLCWFDRDDGRVALACSLAIQIAMQQFSTTHLNTNNTVTIAIKAAIASGTVRRFRIGDEAIQYIDTLAGALLTRISAIEQLLQPGEVIIDRTTGLALDSVVSIREWREHPQTLISGAIVEQLMVEVDPLPALQRTSITANRDHVQSWILPAVRERLEQGTGEFLTELRPAVALFGCFGSLNYDDDPAAEMCLNRYIGWVQNVINRYNGVVLQLTIGDKGNYFYAAFGAPLAHEDDALRAVLAARDLQIPPAELGLGQNLQVGISSGIMRTGAYGSTSRRTYGVLGEAVNLAARLMQHAGPNEILVSETIQQSTAEHILWQGLDDLTVKGKTEPVTLYRYAASLAQSATLPHATLYQLPLIGRAKELQEINSYLSAAQNGQGQVIGVTGEAGIGKSRLISAVTQAAQHQQWRIYGAECQSYSRNTPYSIWQPIWRAIFGINSADPPAAQLASLEAAIARIDPALLLRLPLLAPMVNLTIADTELTGSFDAQLRNASREALLVDWFRAWVPTQLGAEAGLLLIVEDVQWIDQLSASLLIALGRVIEALPVAFLLGYRPFDPTAASVNPISQLSSLREVALFALPEADTSELVAARLDMLEITLNAEELATLVARIIDRTQGNLFYIEELLTYLHSQQHDLHAASVWESGELPTSLHNLILSRIDQLSTSQQTAIKVASVIGRLFRVAWLAGYYPAFNEPAGLQADLEQLHSAALIVQDAPDPELAYLFKHVITQEVAYESLAFPTRALLHEQFARYLEYSAAAHDNQMLYRIAYHYERSTNVAKKREYLRLAGDAAQEVYGNEAAISFYQRLLLLLDDQAEKIEVWIKLGKIFDRVGQWNDAERVYRFGLAASLVIADQSKQAEACHLLGWLFCQSYKIEDAILYLNQARDIFTDLNDYNNLWETNNHLIVSVQAPANSEGAGVPAQCARMRSVR